MYSKAVQSLYKAKSAKTHKWIRGNMIGSNTMYSHNSSLNVPDGVKLIKYNNMMNFEQILPDTICSYTGCRDKRGSKVFLHDVLQYEIFGEVIRYVVRWLQDEMRYVLEDPRTGLCYFGSPESLTLVGNLHDLE